MAENYFELSKKYSALLYSEAEALKIGLATCRLVDLVNPFFTVTKEILKENKKPYFVIEISEILKYMIPFNEFYRKKLYPNDISLLLKNNKNIGKDYGLEFITFGNAIRKYFGKYNKIRGTIILTQKLNPRMELIYSDESDLEKYLKSKINLKTEIIAEFIQ